MTQETNPQDVYKKIRSILENEHIHVSDYESIDYGLQFRVFINGWSGVIRIYQNKKGQVKVDYSQLKNGARAEEIQAIAEGRASWSEAKTVDKDDSELGYPIIGTDESGKGDYFGPLVTAAVYVDEERAKRLTELGVRDSKDLFDGQIAKLSRVIFAICKDRFTVIEISPERYNDLHRQLKTEGKNLNTLLGWSHAKAIEELLCKVDCSVAIADQFGDERYILGELQEKGRSLKLVQRTGAEKHVAVAAASIVARYRFLRKLRELSYEYGLELSKEASLRVIKNGRDFVTKYGREELSKVAKLHFKTTRMVLPS